jgi:hypothetical protein
LALSPGLWAYSTPNVPVDDPVYRDIDKLVAFGLVKDAIYGQRPWSRREIARMVAEAMDKSDRTAPLTPDDRELSERIRRSEILDRLRDRFHTELAEAGAVPGESKNFRLNPLEEVRFDYTLLDSPYRSVPANNGLGAINGVINPLVAYREGRHYVDGNTLGVETTHTAKISPYLSLYARPRLEGLIPNTGNSDFNPLIQQAYAKFAYRSFEIEAGRDSLIWGQGEFGGLVFSNNARPLDLIKVGSGSPFFLPWVFKYLGPNSFQIFFADMGPEQALPHAILSGYKWTIKPVHFFEMGLNHLVMMGGRGANDPSFWEAIGEFSGVLSAATNNKRGGAALTNRLFSLEGRATFPFLRNSVLYSEIAFDDTNSEIDVLFEDNASYYVGFFIPRLTNDGSLDLRLEYKHIPGVAYRHGRYISGYTLNKRLVGDELGPDSDGVSAKISADVGPHMILGAEIAYERRDSDLFSTASSGEDVVDIFKARDNPAEHRARLESSLVWQIRPELRAEFQFGFEYVANADFVRDANAENFMGSVSVAYRPGWFSR